MSLFDGFLKSIGFTPESFGAMTGRVQAEYMAAKAGFQNFAGHVMARFDRNEAMLRAICEKLEIPLDQFDPATIKPAQLQHLNGGENDERTGTDDTGG